MNDQKNTIPKFRYFSKTQLLQLREQLKLTMSESELSLCADHYRTVEKRDPSVEELRLLAILAKKAEQLSSARALTKFLANDTFAAQTYADALQKRQAMTTDPQPPCTLLDFLSIATRYLERAGKSFHLPKHSLMLEDCRYTKRIPSATSGFGISGSAHQIRVLPRKGLTGMPDTGDSLVLFMPREDKSILDYQKRIGAFLNSFGHAAPWKRLGTVHTGGLLLSVIAHGNLGLWIDLSRIASDKYTSPFPPLTEEFVGCHFAIVSPEMARMLIDRASECGIRAIVPATVTHASRMTFVSKGAELFSLGVEFIRKFVTARTATARLSDEPNLPLEQIRHVITSSATCSYLRKTQMQPSTDCVEVGDALCAAAFCKPTYNFYRHALYTSLCSVVSLAVSGLAYTEQRLAIGISTPDCMSDNEETVGNIVSLMLGIYRAQAELGIPSAATSFLTNKELANPQATVFAVAEGKAIAGTYSAVGNPVYCFAPTYDANGLPDFASLRTLLQELTVRSRNGSIVSARVLCNEAVTDGLQKMDHNGLYCRIDGKLASEEALPLAVIIECKAPIEGQKPIGTVEQRSVETEVQEKISAHSVGDTSLIWSDQTEFVLLCTPGDLDAQVLGDVITQKGGRAVLYESDHADAGEISRAILGAHILVLCGDVHFPETRHTRFALETMLRAGGACWIVGRIGFSPLAQYATVFKKNIPETLLDEIMKPKK